MITAKLKRPESLVRRPSLVASDTVNGTLARLYDDAYERFNSDFLNRDYRYAMDMIYPGLKGAVEVSFEFYSQGKE